MSTRTRDLKKLPKEIRLPLPPLPAGYERWQLCGFGGLRGRQMSPFMYASGSCHDWGKDPVKDGDYGIASGFDNLFYIRAIKTAPSKPTVAKKARAIKAKISQQVHHLKTWPAFYPSVLDRSKPFEVRKDDRNFMVGDLLILEEYDPNKCRYTGRHCKRTVTFVLRGGGFGVEPTHCVMGLGIIPARKGKAK